MIDIKATVRGESDTPPFVRMFRYLNEEEELMFFNCAIAIKEKIEKKLKINTNESLIIYCAYVIDQVREHKSRHDIESNVYDILSCDQVLIGVPETLREITLDIVVDKFPKQQVRFREPMKVSDYILT